MFIASNSIVNSFGIIKQLLPALEVNIITVQPWDIVFPQVTIMMFTLSAGNNLYNVYRFKKQRNLTKRSET